MNESTIIAIALVHSVSVLYSYCSEFFAATVVVGLFLARGGKTLMYGLADVMMIWRLYWSVMITSLACTVTLLPQNITLTGTELPPPHDSRI